MEQNKTGKYLKYAIGEILLVMIGILLALQVNNWNQKRINNSKEKVYLINIQKEITKTSVDIRRHVIDRMSAKIEGLELAKKYCENDLKITDTLEVLTKITYGGVFSGGGILGLRNYYDELLSTGNFQLIKKDTIKNAITDYYGSVEFHTSRSKYGATQFANYADGLRPYNSNNPKFISKFDQIEMIEAFKSVEFRILVDAELSYAYRFYGQAKQMVRKVELLNELINKELNGEL